MNENDILRVTAVSALLRKQIALLPVFPMRAGIVMTGFVTQDEGAGQKNEKAKEAVAFHKAALESVLQRAYALYTRLWKILAGVSAHQHTRVCK